MESYKREFIKFLESAGVLKFGDFTAKSGRKIPYFINAGDIKTGEQIRKLGEFYAKAYFEKIGNKKTVLYGPAYKGIPIAVSVAVALSANGLAHKPMWSDIGIMQKLSTRVENGETWYYTGAYSGNFNCIIKSRDLVTWEYVAAPAFTNESLWENAVYVVGDKCWYFVRQDACMQGFLTAYDLQTGMWAVPTLVRDAQSRSDFIWYNGALYLIHAPIDRNGFGILQIDRENPAASKPIAVADMHDSLFYPYTDLYGDYAYMSYTVARKHIRLTRFPLAAYLE